MDVSDLKSRAPCGHEGSIFAYGFGGQVAPTFGINKTLLAKSGATRSDANLHNK